MANLKAVLFGLVIICGALLQSEGRLVKRWVGNDQFEDSEEFDGENNEGSELTRRAAGGQVQQQKPSDKYEFPQFPDDEFEESQQQPSLDTVAVDQSSSQGGQQGQFPAEEKYGQVGQETEYVNRYPGKGGQQGNNNNNQGKYNELDTNEIEESGKSAWYKKPWHFLKKQYNTLKEKIRGGRDDYYI